jgi:uncharacterized paraquat-inducible protein A
MATDHPMFCKRCYANLDQATDACCLRCGRKFLPQDSSSYLHRPFPSRIKMIVHTLITLVLATLVSFVVATILALAQLKYIHSGH